MEASLSGSTVILSGILDEHTSAESIMGTVKAGMDAVGGNRLRFDFSQVRRANSVGILTWFKLVDALRPLVSYVNVPIWLVEQFNFSDALRGNALVESFQAPFYCPETDQHSVMTLVIGKDVPLLTDYSDFALSIRNSDGTHSEPDFEPDEYFQFLVAYYAKFKAQGLG